MALGKIGGKLLSPNLVRDGVDLTIRNDRLDSDILYLDVNADRIGINTDAPVFDLDVPVQINTENLNITNTGTLGNVVIDAQGFFTTTVGPINIVPTQENPLISFDEIHSDEIFINDNIIGSLNSNSSIEVETSGIGTINLLADTNISGNLGLTGDVTIDGNLSTIANIVIGNEEFDTVVINPPLEEKLEPGLDNTYDLGRQAGDSSPRRWAEIHVANISTADNYVPDRVIISDQLLIDGITREITTLQSNDDVILLPGLEIIQIDDTTFDTYNSTKAEIINNFDTPFSIAHTGIGYLRFIDTNAIVIPAGDNSTRPSRPEVGDTRWNTDLQYLEVFAGRVEQFLLVSGDVSGLIDQTIENVVGITNNSGLDARINLQISSGVLTFSVGQSGRGYIAGDSFVVSGTVFSGGSSPNNDLTFTIGNQTDAGYIISTGGGEEVTDDIMEDLGNEFALILG